MTDLLMEVLKVAGLTALALLAGAALDAMEQGHTVQEVADTIGWSQRASVYNLLKEFHHE